MTTIHATMQGLFSTTVSAPRVFDKVNGALVPSAHSVVCGIALITHEESRRRPISIRATRQSGRSGRSSRRPTARSLARQAMNVMG